MDISAMTELIDDTMLSTLAVRGTPQQCADEIARRFGDVAERVCVYFPGYTATAENIAALAGALHRH
jgi:alkanesulfonate monooxygenase SsuD/methylene tetrahydromethanopterin reductase-like flavin-dependent oxidoreductase (luciferase family)